MPGCVDNIDASLRWRRTLTIDGNEITCNIRK